MLWLPQTLPVPAGTRIEARLESSVDTRHAAVGAEVVAVLIKPVLAGNVKVVEQGSRLHGRVETVAEATASNPGRVRLVFREIELADGRRIPTWITDAYAAPSPKRTLPYFLYIAAGGAGGALIGGTHMRTGGALGGSIIGFVIAMNSGGGKLPDLTLKPGQVLHLKLGEDLRMK
jgi:hypothetical protein